jgi:hypothetical protein
MKSSRKLYLLLSCSLVVFYMTLHHSFFSNSQDGISQCIHMKVLGFECPGCGFTRAVYNLFTMHIKRAIYFNPAVVLLPPVIIIEIVHWIFQSEYIKRLRLLIYMLFLTALFLVYLLRIYYKLNTIFS